MERRTFVQVAALSGQRILGASGQVRGAVIGSGGRGRLLTAEFKEIGVEMGAVCDVYEPNLEAGLKAASTGARAYSDYRRLLEDGSIDVVIVATPDHWHAQMAIDAVEAGKDVYVEKPLAHTIDEGFRIVDAVRRTGRVLQVGTQRRSWDLFQDAKKVRDTGGLGEVRLVTASWYNRQGPLEARPLTGKLDWKQWLGSAPQRPVDPLRFRNWYYFPEYSGGMMIGQCAHLLDAIVWFMGSAYPEAVTCAAGKPALEGAGFPETTSFTAEYPENYIAVLTVGYMAMRYSLFCDQLKQFHGRNARFDVAREAYALYREDPKALEMKPVVEVKRPGSFESATRMHIRNFLEAVRDRKDPSAPVEAGQHTNVALCMAMESLKIGRRVRFNAAERRMEI